MLAGSVREYSCQNHKRNTSKEAQLLQKISDQRKELETLEVNVKLLIELKQGQVEVTAPTPLITYEDACLVHRDVIDECNNAILFNGKQKINTLEMVKVRRPGTQARKKTTVPRCTVVS